MHSTDQQGAAPWTFAKPWGGTGHLADIDGPVHWVRFDAPSAPGDGELATRLPVVLVHGLGGSHLNWVRIAPRLAADRRVYALDLAGFGLTTAGHRSTSVHANAELVDRFIRTVVGGPAILIGNSMGGMISLLVADSHPESVAGLVLIDPSVPVPRQLPDLQVASQFFLYAVPFFGERYLAASRNKMSDRQLVQRVINLCFADPSRASQELLAASTALVAQRRAMPAQDAAFLQAARSLMRVIARPKQFTALMRRVGSPVLFIHGDRDRLVPVAAAQLALADNPGWQGVVLPGVGHTPQLESPELVLKHLEPWLATLESAPRG
ncbi:MAG: alpha/beta fold hydrolase [Actinomycetota bacterium]|nr:alpha/beta fold hydrolase [Actinomycetota bacterium]